MSADEIEIKWGPDYLASVLADLLCRTVLERDPECGWAANQMDRGLLEQDLQEPARMAVATGLWWGSKIASLMSAQAKQDASEFPGTPPAERDQATAKAAFRIAEQCASLAAAIVDGETPTSVDLVALLDKGNTLMKEWEPHMLRREARAHVHVEAPATLSMDGSPGATDVDHFNAVSGDFEIHLSTQQLEMGESVGAGGPVNLDLRGARLEKVSTVQTAARQQITLDIEARSVVVGKPS